LKIKTKNKHNKKDIDFLQECKNIGWIGEKKKGWESVHTVTDGVMQDSKKIDEILKKNL